MTNAYLLAVGDVLSGELLDEVAEEFPTIACALTGVSRPDDRLRMAAPAVAAPAPTRNFLLSESMVATSLRY